jgi:hypothetical protein
MSQPGPFCHGEISGGVLMELGLPFTIEWSKRELARDTSVRRDAEELARVSVNLCTSAPERRGPAEEVSPRLKLLAVS